MANNYTGDTARNEAYEARGWKYIPAGSAGAAHYLTPTGGIVRFNAIKRVEIKNTVLTHFTGPKGGRYRIVNGKKRYDLA